MVLVQGLRHCECRHREEKHTLTIREDCHETDKNLLHEQTERVHPATFFPILISSFRDPVFGTVFWAQFRYHSEAFVLVPNRKQSPAGGPANAK